jgi:hypothetical protein
MIQRKRSRLSLAEKQDIWHRWKCGQSMHPIGRAHGRPHPTIRQLPEQANDDASGLVAKAVLFFS